MWMYGFTEQNRTGRYMVFSHTGNQGATLDDVRKDLDYMNGVGFFDALTASAKAIGVSDKGFPDYSWSLKVPNWLYENCRTRAVSVK